MRRCGRVRQFKNINARKLENLLYMFEDLILVHFHDVVVANEDDVVADPHAGLLGGHA